MISKLKTTPRNLKGPPPPPNHDRDKRFGIDKDLTSIVLPPLVFFCKGGSCIYRGGNPCKSVKSLYHIIDYFWFRVVINRRLK